MQRLILHVQHAFRKRINTGARSRNFTYAFSTVSFRNIDTLRNFINKSNVRVCLNLSLFYFFGEMGIYVTNGDDLSRKMGKGSFGHMQTM